MARWDGVSWSGLGAGLTAGSTGVRALAAFDDGAGRRLYAGGSLIASGGTPMPNVASWDGNTWSAVGDGFDVEVDALCAFDDGAGAVLYAGGLFDFSGDAVAGGIAGGYLLLATIKQQATLANMAIGVGAFAVLGAIWTFVASSFLQVLGGALWQAALSVLDLVDPSLGFPDAAAEAPEGPAARDLPHRLVRQRARTRHHTDLTFLMYRAWHDADLAFARCNDARAVGPDNAHTFAVGNHFHQ